MNLFLYFCDEKKEIIKYKPWHVFYILKPQRLYVLSLCL
jgi:hypothetical protein